MANVVILGAGLMGTAFATPLTDNGHRVHLVGTHLDGDMIEEIHDRRFHPRLRAHVPAQVAPYSYDRLSEAMGDADLVVLGVNSLGVEWAASRLGETMDRDVPILMLTKGLDGDRGRLEILPQVLRRGLPVARRKEVRVAAVGGPSIAGELAARRHTCVMITGEDDGLLQELASLLRTSYYHVWTSTDVVGVEVSVAMKNVYALAVGLVGGFLEREVSGEGGAVMHNLAAAIFAQGLDEIAYLVDVMGGRSQSAYRLPGAGDLYVTSMGGRNGRMGRWLGQGIPYSQAKATYMADETVEGAELALAIGETVDAMVADGRLDAARIPLLRTMIEVVCRDAEPHIPWDDFFCG